MFKLASKSRQRKCIVGIVVSRHRLSTLGRRSFSVAGPMVWNSLPVALRDLACGIETFKQLLKTYNFPSTRVCSTLEVSH